MDLTQENILKAAAQAAEQMNGNPHPTASVTPQPVPTAVQLASTRSVNGDKFVIITLTTPVGQNIYFLDPDSAEKIGEGLKETARLARTGLEIAR